MQIKDNCNYGTSELVSLSRIFLGMRDFHLKKLAKFMELNSKRILEISSSPEEVEPTKSKSLMATICSNHAHKSKT